MLYLYNVISMEEHKLKPGKILVISLKYSSSIKEELLKLIWNIETDYATNSCILWTVNLKTKKQEKFHLTIDEAILLNEKGMFYEKYKYSKEMITVFKLI